MNADMIDQLKTLAKEKEAIESEKTELLREKALLETDAADTRCQVQALLEEKASAEADASALTEEKKKLDSMNVDMANQLATLKEELSASEANIQVLTNEKRTIASNNDVLCHQKASLESSKNELQCRVQALLEEKASAEANVRALAEEKKKLDSLNVGMAGELDALKERLSSFEAKMQALVNEKDATKHNSADIKSDDRSNLFIENNGLLVTNASLQAELEQIPWESNEATGFASSPAEVSSHSAFGQSHFYASVVADDDDGESLGSFEGPIVEDQTTTPSKRKRRSPKVYSSPKKWRRMIRDNRLQSIFIDI